MECSNNKTEKPLSYYRNKFAQSDPNMLAAKSGIAYDSNASCFALTVLGTSVSLSWPEGRVLRHDDTTEVSPSVTILLMRLLIDGTLVPSTGKFIPYADIPWGSEYLEPFTGRCLKRLAYSFSCAHAFAIASENVGAKRLSEDSKADEAYVFEFVPGVYIQALFWEGDDEFEPRAQLLFSDNISLAFTAEDVAVVGDTLITALKTGGLK